MLRFEVRLAQRWLERSFSRVLRTARAFEADDAALLAGGIAFYTVLSFAPMLVIALALAARVLGQDAASGALSQALIPTVGAETAGFVSEVLQRSYESGHGPWATLGSTAVTLYAGTRLFSSLQIALNRVWGVPKEDHPWRHHARQMLSKRLLALVLVLGLGLVLVATVVWRGVLRKLATYVGLHSIPWFFWVLDLATAFAALSLMLAAIYRYLPDARIRWRHVFVGAAVTALLLSVGAVLVGMYFDYAGVRSTYGAAGTVVVLMLATYYFAIIFLFGAEMTGVMAAEEGGVSLNPMAGGRPRAVSGSGRVAGG